MLAKRSRSSVSLTTAELSAFKIHLDSDHVPYDEEKQWIPLEEHDDDRHYTTRELTSKTAWSTILYVAIALILSGYSLAQVLRFGPMVTEWTADIVLAADRGAARRHVHLHDLAFNDVNFATDPKSLQGSEWSCDPFKQLGRLHIDQATPEETYWEPYDDSCRPSTLMKTLMSKRVFRGADVHLQPRTRWDMPWLINSTILLQGDSIERIHLVDFCRFVGGRIEHITPDHPASPAPYRMPIEPVLDQHKIETPESRHVRNERRKKEAEWDKRKEGWAQSRPYVCDVPEISLTLIAVNAWTMQDMEDAFETENFFHGPASWLDRFQHITLPLLRNVADYLDRPQVTKPDLIEISSGYWDLRGFAEQDFAAAGVAKPYPLESAVTAKPIGKEREELWVEDAKTVVKSVAHAFPGTKDLRSGPVISWRTMHPVEKNAIAPPNRVNALDQLARKTMHDLRVSSYKSYHEHVKRAQTVFREPDLGLDERLRVNEIGRLMNGHTDHLYEIVHPDQVMSFVWSDIMLYELKRAKERIGRSPA